MGQMDGGVESGEWPCALQLAERRGRSLRSYPVFQVSSSSTLCPGQPANVRDLEAWPLVAEADPALTAAADNAPPPELASQSRPFGCSV